MFHPFFLTQSTNKTMAIIITDECTNCDLCVPECPNNAIYAPDDEWAYSDGTELSGSVTLLSGEEVDADEKFEALSDEIYFIIPNKCTECNGFHEEPQCAAVCPVDCCVDDPDRRESEEDLLAKKVFLHDE